MNKPRSGNKGVEEKIFKVLYEHNISVSTDYLKYLAITIREAINQPPTKAKEIK